MQSDDCVSQVEQSDNGVSLVNVSVALAEQSNDGVNVPLTQVQL